MRTPVRRFRLHSSLVLAVLLAGAATIACTAYRWSPRPITNLMLADSATAADSLSRELVQRRQIRLELETGTLELYVHRLAFPYLHGNVVMGAGDTSRRSEPLVAVDLDAIKWMRLARDDSARSPRRGERIDLTKGPDLAPIVGGRTVYFGSQQSVVVLRDVRVVAPRMVEGRLVAAQSDGRVRVDLRGMQGLALRELDGTRTLVRTAVGIGATVGAVALLVALTKESCPFVYADTGAGWELQGEAYAGAAFRSTQRDDLLPIASPGARASLRVRLRNEARETQYTDRAALVLVDHAPSVRALSTFDGRPILVGESRAALRVRDEHGRDLARELARRDELLAETDAVEVTVTADSVLRDVITAEFAPPARGTAVLELVVGNTTLLDLAFGRFFAAMGDRLDGYIARGNEPAAGPRIRGWREREGVDLIVEVEERGAWRRVAVVPTVGPAALRQIAVPLPRVADGGAPLRVRLRSGLGFWRVDRLALAVLENDAPSTTVVSPERALGSADRDERATLAATDGRYNALSLMNESVDMDFALPPLAAGRARSAFLSTTGYYNVHPPVQAAWLPRTLKTIRDEPGAFARFARDLARVYEREAVLVAVRP